MVDIRQLLNRDDYNAIIGANAPGAGNVFATMNDISGMITTTVATDPIWNLLGDTVYGTGVDTSQILPGDTSNTRKFLRGLSIAGVAQAPAWDVLILSDLPAIALDNLSDVTVPTPNSGDNLVWSGTEWIASPAQTVVGGATAFYLDQTSTFIDNLTLSVTPSVYAETIKTVASVQNTNVFFERFVSPAIGRTQIPAGIWEFNIYAASASTAGTDTINFRINNRVILNAMTITIDAGITVTRTFTIAGGTPLVAGDANANILLASLLEMGVGLSPTGQTGWITIFGSSSSGTIQLTDAGFAPGGGTFSLNAIYYHLFDASTADINSVGVLQYDVTTIQPAFTVNATDRLVLALFAYSTNAASKNMSLYYGGTLHYTHFHSPLTTLHNDLAGLNDGDYKHLTNAQYTSLAAVAVLVATGTAGFMKVTGINTVAIDTNTYLTSAIGGTLTATQVAYGTAVDTIGGEASFTWVTGTKTLTLKGLAAAGANTVLDVQSNVASVLAIKDDGSIFGTALTVDFVKDTVFIGELAGSSNTVGTSNIFIGTESGYGNMTGTSNVYIGYNAGYTNDGSYNVVIGDYALSGAIISSGNFALGFQAGLYTTGDNNSFLGTFAGQNNTIGTFNIGLGYGALEGDPVSFMEGSYNIGIGNKTGASLTTGENNVFIGRNAGYNQDSNSNILIIDNSVAATGRTSVAFEATDSLIYGVFDATASAQTLNLNAQVTARYGLIVGNGGTNYTLPSTRGTAGQVLRDVAGNGTVTWITLTAGDVSAQSANATLSSIAGLVYVSPAFLKLTAANTVTLDTATYLTAETDTLAAVTGRGATTTVSTIFQNVTAIELGKDETAGTPNIAGKMKLWSAGDNAFYTTFVTGTQTQNIAYTLPVDDGTANQVLATDGSGVLSWATVSGVATDPIWAANGDLVMGTGNDAAEVLTMGTAYQKLHVNSAGTDIEWVSIVRTIVLASPAVYNGTATLVSGQDSSTDTAPNPNVTSYNRYYYGFTGNSLYADMSRQFVIPHDFVSWNHIKLEIYGALDSIFNLFIYKRGTTAAIWDSGVINPTGVATWEYVLPVPTGSYTEGDEYVFVLRIQTVGNDTARFNYGVQSLCYNAK